MRLYILAIGGTGSRVLQSLVMQLAAGILPPDPVSGNPMTEISSIVPIIIDPHKDNDAVQSTNTLLGRYSRIRTSIYGDNPTCTGFYGMKIESLKDVTSDNSKKTTYKLSDSFIFDMPAVVASRRFKDFIGLNDPGVYDKAKLLTKSLFSTEELDTQMSEGFYGSPNIGTIALSIFKDSDAYAALGERFQEGDRLFFIGSIFGGTGASGLPMLVSTLRQDNKYPCMQKAFMGALIVMPYFSIQSKEGSEIQERDFAIKTKKALKYYVDNLYPYLNVTYYLADVQKTNPFENDAGKNQQKANKAHFVEFIGGMSVLNFLHQISKNSGNDTVIDNGHIHAAAPKYLQFELKEEADTFGFSELGEETNKLVFRPMTSYHILKRFIKDGFFSESLSQPYAKKRAVDNSAVTDDMERFFDEYDTWLSELSDHGSGAHNFMPFIFLDGDDFSSEINGVETQKGIFGKKKFKVPDLIKELNDSKTHEDEWTASRKLYSMMADAMDKAIDEYYDTTNIIEKRK